MTENLGFPRNPFNILVNGRFCFESFPRVLRHCEFEISSGNPDFFSLHWMWSWKSTWTSSPSFPISITHAGEGLQTEPRAVREANAPASLPRAIRTLFLSNIFQSIVQHRSYNGNERKMGGGGEIIPSLITTNWGQIELFSVELNFFRSNWIFSVELIFFGKYLMKIFRFLQNKIKSGQKMKKNDQNGSFQRWPRKRRKTKISKLPKLITKKKSNS